MVARPSPTQTTSLSLSLSLSQPGCVTQWLNCWLRAVEVPGSIPGGCFQEHPVVLTICGTSYIVTTKCRPVGQGGFGSKRVAPEEGSPSCSAETHAGACWLQTPTYTRAPRVLFLAATVLRTVAVVHLTRQNSRRQRRRAPRLLCPQRLGGCRHHLSRWIKGLTPW